MKPMTKIWIIEFGTILATYGLLVLIPDLLNNLVFGRTPLERILLGLILIIIGTFMSYIAQMEHWKKKEVKHG